MNPELRRISSALIELRDPTGLQRTGTVRMAALIRFQPLTALPAIARSAKSWGAMDDQDTAIRYGACRGRVWAVARYDIWNLDIPEAVEDHM